MFFWDSFSLEDNDHTCVQYRCETFEKTKKKVKCLPFCFMVQINLQQKSIQQIQVSPFEKPDQQVVEDPF